AARRATSDVGTPALTLRRSEVFFSQAQAATRRFHVTGVQTCALPTAVTTLPTPTVGDSRNSRNATANRTAPKPTTNTGSSTLSDVAHLMPTPRTTDANGGGSTAPEALTCVPPSPALLPTPNAYLGSSGGTQHPTKRRAGG